MIKTSQVKRLLAEEVTQEQTKATRQEEVPWSLEYREEGRSAKSS